MAFRSADVTLFINKQDYPKQLCFWFTFEDVFPLLRLQPADCGEIPSRSLAALLFSFCAVCVNTWPFTLELDGEELSDHDDNLWCSPVFHTVGTKECPGWPQFGAAGPSRTRRSGSREEDTDDHTADVGPLAVSLPMFLRPLFLRDVIETACEGRWCLISFSFSCVGLVDALQIQCYQCEEMKQDCSAPEYVVNCTVNVQDMCQKEVLVRADGQSNLGVFTFGPGSISDSPRVSCCRGDGDLGPGCAEVRWVSSYIYSNRWSRLWFWGWIFHQTGSQRLPGPARRSDKSSIWAISSQQKNRRCTKLNIRCNFSLRQHIASVFSCRHPLSEVVRVIGGVSHCLLWLPAVLYRQAELRLHLLLQHAALQRAQKKASHLIRSSNVRPAVNNTDAPSGVLRDAPPPDVDRGSPWGLNGINHEAVGPD